ncbi:serine palmitoyltransferase component [Nowakowskiella sp. JEL0078]|nr:serine palmitoyltransferase component [Nowakowskiella sp. JEL0078]
MTQYADNEELAGNIAIAINTTYILAGKIYSSVPGASILYKYVRSSYQGDPIRTFLELLLLVFLAWYFYAKRYKPGMDVVKLSEKEIDDLCEEWVPEPLVPELTEFQKLELEKIQTISSAAGPKVMLQTGKLVVNLTANNFLGIMNQDQIKEKAIETLRTYGVGSCGPPGFYGTLDVHMELEQKLALFVGAEAAIIYSQGFSTIASSLPAFAKRGDIIVADDGVSFAIQKGLVASRSIVKYFKHNDMDDLERVLNQIASDDRKQKKKTPTRRFLVVEGIYADYCDIAPLPKLIITVELKKKFKYRLVIEESYSFGVLGKRGAGIADHFSISPKFLSDIDMIAVSMCNTLASAGGFVAGSKEVVDHQRLSAQAYTFSASLPAMLAVSAIEALNLIFDQPLHQMRENTKATKKILASLENEKQPLVSILGIDNEVPMIQICLKNRLQTRELEERFMQDVVDQVSFGVSNCGYF